MRETATCGFPGCINKLSRRNTIGVCPIHAHTSACKCAACIRVTRPAKTVRPGCKVVRIPYTGIYSGYAQFTEVTLPQAPWEAA